MPKWYLCGWQRGSRALIARTMVQELEPDGQDCDIYDGFPKQPTVGGCEGVILSLRTAHFTSLQLELSRSSTATPQLQAQTTSTAHAFDHKQVLPINQIHDSVEGHICGTMGVGDGLLLKSSVRKYIHHRGTRLTFPSRLLQHTKGSLNYHRMYRASIPIVLDPQSFMLASYSAECRARMAACTAAPSIPEKTVSTST